MSEKYEEAIIECDKGIELIDYFDYDFLKAEISKQMREFEGTKLRA